MLARLARLTPGTQILRHIRRALSRLSHYVLLHRVSALGRALLCVAGLALTALGTHAHAHGAPSRERDVDVRVEQSIIESSDAPPTDDARAAEQLQLVSTGVRSVVRAALSGVGLMLTVRQTTSWLHGDAPRWCDVVQCRRLGGAMVLSFATPPPTQR